VSAEEALYELACQDMPVSGDEVREAMNAYAHELAEKIRPMCSRAGAACADSIDPKVLNSGG
jgi:hypothetical protein